jgi:hypothetical protein
MAFPEFVLIGFLAAVALAFLASMFMGGDQ